MITNKTLDHTTTVVFDFDGVLNSYKSGWCGAGHIPDPPVEGAKAEVDRFRRAGYSVAVVSARAREPFGREAIEMWLQEHDFIVDYLGCEKVPAIAYIDDRGITFNGSMTGLLEQVQKFKPWCGHK